MRRNTLLIIVSLLIIIVVSIAAIVGWEWKSRHDSRQTKMIYGTWRCIRQVCTEIETMMVENPQIALPKSFAEMKEYFIGIKAIKDNPPCQMILEGRDAWDRPLMFDRRDNSTLLIRSFGPNGLDDHGEVDDLQYVIDVGAFRKILSCFRWNWNSRVQGLA